jgi:hypothetical protein
MPTLEEVDAGKRKAQHMEAQEMEYQEKEAQKVKAQKNDAQMEFQKWKALRQGTRSPEDQVPEQLKVAGAKEPYELTSPERRRRNSILSRFTNNTPIGPSGIMTGAAILSRFQARENERNAGQTEGFQYACHTSPSPPSFDHPATLRKQDQLIDRENKRAPRPEREHFRLIYGTGKPSGQGTTIPEKFEENGHVDLPAYSQAYNESAARLEQDLKISLMPLLGFNLSSLPGLGPHIPPQSKSHGPKSSNSQHNFVPISKSAFFPTQSSPSPPQERNTDGLLDTLRAEFDNKLSFLEERLERKIGTDAQSLSTIRDLEMKLKESEAEKEKYKERVAELEKKVAMMKDWRE